MLEAAFKVSEESGTESNPDAMSNFTQKEKKLNCLIPR